MNYIQNDGGRANAGYKGTADDCAVRAMAIALGLDYKTAYKELAEAHKLRTGKKTAREGIYKETFSTVIARYGFVWHKAPVFEGRKAKCHDMPKGRVIARQARHFAAVIDGTPHDIFDCSKKMVYGYYART